MIELLEYYLNRTVSELLELGPNTIYDEDMGDTILHTAARYNEVSMVGKILKKPNADPNLLNDCGYSPLSIACLNNCPRIVEILLEDPRTIPNIGSPLFYATVANNTEIAKMLIGIPELNVNHKEPLVNASIANNLELVEMLLSREEIQINRQDEDGRTALHIACKNNNTEIVELLLKHGALRNIQDRWGNTCFYYATRKTINKLYKTALTEMVITRSPKMPLDVSRRIWKTIF